MRTNLFQPALLAMLSLPVNLAAQTGMVELQAGIGYARLFDGGGFSLALGADRALSSPTRSLQHAVGAGIWYARTTIASDPDDPYGRRMLGLGLRYQLGIGACCRLIHPFVALPVQLLRSNIPDRDFLVPQPALSGIPESPAPRPVEDVIGAEWGWGLGLELGLRLHIDDRLGARTSLLGMHHDIYRASTRDNAWSWHAGLSYRLGN
jgi:hypothetical protein